MRQALSGMLQNRNFSHDVDRAIPGRTGLSIEKIDEDRFPLGTGQRQVKCRLVGIARLGETEKTILGHAIAPQDTRMTSAF